MTDKEYEKLTAWLMDGCYDCSAVIPHQPLQLSSLTNPSPLGVAVSKLLVVARTTKKETYKHVIIESN